MATNDSVNVGLSGITGSGTFVGASSPTLITPILGVATATSLKFSGNNGLIDSNGNELLSLSPTASSVDYWTIANAATGGNPTLSMSGSDTNIIGYLQGKGTGTIATKGTGTNDSAPSGYIGQFVSSQIVYGSAISITTATVTNITSISLTAGDWDVSGQVSFVPSVAFNAVAAAINTTSATLPDFSLYSLVQATLSSVALAVVMQRISISSTTTVYLIGQVSFATGSATACGFIGARRVR
jgi:hypothetical protein